MSEYFLYRGLSLIIVITAINCMIDLGVIELDLFWLVFYKAGAVVLLVSAAAELGFNLLYNFFKQRN